MFKMLRSRLSQTYVIWERPVMSEKGSFVCSALRAASEMALAVSHGLTVDRHSAQYSWWWLRLSWKVVHKGRPSLQPMNCFCCGLVFAFRYCTLHYFVDAGKALFWQSVWLLSFSHRLILTHFLFLFAFYRIVEGSKPKQVLSKCTLASTLNRTIKERNVI